jgi:hypothetical protein
MQGEWVVRKIRIQEIIVVVFHSSDCDILSFLFCFPFTQHELLE